MIRAVGAGGAEPQRAPWPFPVGFAWLLLCLAFGGCQATGYHPASAIRGAEGAEAGGASGEEDKPDAQEVAKKLANPASPLASLTLKGQGRWFDGDLPGADDESSFTMLFQPSFPFALDNGDRILWRPAVSLLVDQPVLPDLAGGETGFDEETGLSDISFDLVYARTTDDGILYGAGLFSTLPTATSSELGSGQWSLGPELLVAKLAPSYVLGVLSNHQWDVVGWSEDSVSLTTISAFATWLPGGGWNVGSNPIMNYDWEIREWTIPINLTVGRTVVLGSIPWKVSAEVNYYTSRPDAFGPEWMGGVSVAPVVPNFLAGLLP